MADGDGMNDARSAPYLELSFRPTVATICSARRFVSSFYEPLLGDADAASRVALAAHELLENALKYSTDGETVMRVAVSSSERPSSVTVETVNRIAPERREGLDAAFDEMKRCGDASEHYQRAMHRTRKRRDGSGLGLARIWAEAEMRLERAYEGAFVRITAVATLPEAQR